MPFKDYIAQIINTVRDLKLRMNHNVMVFLVFFGIGVFFWFLKAMDKSYVTQIEHPVIYERLPDNKVLVNKMPGSLLLEVEGKGDAILRHNWDISKSPVKINYNQFNSGSGQDQNYTVSLPTVQFKAQISSQLNNLNVISILPDNLIFQFSEEYSKKVPIVADLEVDLEKQYMIRDKVLITPDSIIVSGPGIIIDTLKQIFTSFHRYKKVDHSLRRNLNLVNPHDQLILSEKRALVEVNIEQFTEKSLMVPVTSLNIPDSLALKTFPASVEITFRVVVSAFEQIQPEDFELSADYFDIQQSGNQKIKPKLSVLTGLVENPKINPEWIDYLLEKR